MDLIHHRMDERILLLEAPPRHGKSELISKWLPTWYLSRYPDRRVILTSYSGDLATHWGRKVRDLVSTTGVQWFNSSVAPGTTSASDWETTQGGGMLTAGIGGPMTGRGANLMIIDDPIKNDEEALSTRIRERHWDWWQSTASTRLEPGGVVVLMQTRWHQLDLSGMMLKSMHENEGQPVHRVSYPAIATRSDDPLGRDIGEALWPERWPREALELKKRSMTPYWWQSLYQQNPTSHQNVEWPGEYFDEIWADEWPDRFELSAISLDASKGREKSDYQAIVFVGVQAGKLYVDTDIDRRPLPELVPQLSAMVNRYRPDAVVIEDNAFQELLLPEFVKHAKEHGTYPCQVSGITNSTMKLIRIRRLGGPLAQGRVKLRRGNPYNQRLLGQLRDFPMADHDDGPDALEMAVRKIHAMISETINA